MSSYDGIDTLESWLEHEVFGFVPTPEMVALFEEWREPMENHLRAYLDTDDGYGNNYSWRAWGCGYCIFSKEDEVRFDELVKKAKDLHFNKSS